MLLLKNMPIVLTPFYRAFSIKNDFAIKTIDGQIKERHQECGKGDDGDGVPRKLPVRSVFV